ncbi:hypothetical protein [Brevundimonas sp. GCM10030266]|uniref:hypothetical protein n=1 Tax=Brevundimonas sp. GCM10030266 TaxID=3273386 RepID=UPI0036147118
MTQDLIEARREPQPATIIAGHIDGPLLVYSDGQMHWLSVWERVKVALGLDNANSIQNRKRPDLRAHREGEGR